MWTVLAHVLENPYINTTDQKSVEVEVGKGVSGGVRMVRTNTLSVQKINFKGHNVSAQMVNPFIGTADYCRSNTMSITFLTY